MPTAKSILTNIVESQPDDATYEEILREIFFELMIQRGLEDARNNNVLSHEEMVCRIKSWQDQKR